MVVIQCFGVYFLVEGCGPRRCGPPGGVDLAAYSAYLDCCFRAAALLTVKFHQPSHEFTFGVGMNFISYPLILTPLV
jgi:hypothetical protein